MKTLQELEALPDDELRVMLAELEGWQRLATPEPLLWKRDGITHVVGHADWRGPDTRLKQTEDIPNFCGDLNACHEVEMRLKNDCDYVAHLREVVGNEAIDMIFAAARQRTIALILTLQKP